jgi:hypothetical protein
LSNGRVGWGLHNLPATDAALKALLARVDVTIFNSLIGQPGITDKGMKNYC